MPANLASDARIYGYLDVASNNIGAHKPHKSPECGCSICAAYWRGVKHAQERDEEKNDDLASSGETR